MNNYVSIKYTGQCVSPIVDLPSSKSISNRVLIIQQLMERKPTIIGLSKSQDTEYLEQILSTSSSNSSNILDAYEGGTTLRFALAYLSQTEGEWILNGSSRLLQRPLIPLIDALKSIGADIEYIGAPMASPLRIKGKKLVGKEIQIDNSKSSQFVSALMLIAPNITNGLQINLMNNYTSIAYIDLTINIMKEFGALISKSDNKIIIEPHPYERIENYTIESDWSSAAPWYLLQSLIPSNEVFLKGLKISSHQPDSRLNRIFNSLNIQSIQTDLGIQLRSSALFHDEVDSINLSQCPDITMAIACAMAAKNIKCEISGLDTLNYKESQRLDLLSRFLNELGYSNNCPTNDKIIIEGQRVHKQYEKFTIDPKNDHRLAMTYAIMAAAGTPIEILDYNCVKKSYPEFWSEMQKCGYDLQFNSKRLY